MKKNVKTIIALSLVFLIITVSLFSCGKNISGEEIMEKYITPIQTTIEEGYKDFDVLIQEKDSNGEVVTETLLVVYNGEGSYYFSYDEKATSGIEEQQLVVYDSVSDTFTSYRINRGEENTTHSTMTKAEVESIINQIYSNYFEGALPKEADKITESKRLAIPKNWSNYEVRYNDGTKACVLRFNTLTDKIHSLEVTEGSGEALHSTEVLFNYPGNVISSITQSAREIPSLNTMILNAKVTPADSTPAEETTQTE